MAREVRELEVRYRVTAGEGQEGPHEDLIALVAYEHAPDTGTYTVRGDPWPGRPPGDVSASGATLREAVLNWIGASLDAREQEADAAVREARSQRGADRRADRADRQTRRGVVS